LTARKKKSPTGTGTNTTSASEPTSPAKPTYVVDFTRRLYNRDPVAVVAEVARPCLADQEHLITCVIAASYPYEQHPLTSRQGAFAVTSHRVLFFAILGGDRLALIDDVPRKEVAFLTYWDPPKVSWRAGERTVNVGGFTLSIGGRPMKFHADHDRRPEIEKAIEALGVVSKHDPPRHAVHTSAVPKQLSRTERSTWRHLQRYETGDGVVPLPVQLPELPSDATDDAQRARELFALVAGLRLALNGMWMPVTFSVPLVQNYLQVSQGRAEDAIRALLAADVIAKVGEERRRLHPDRGADVYEPMGWRALP
jgi:hypothetical protein